MFIEECSKTNLIKAMKLDPVFIIPDDRKNFNAIQKKTKSDVSNIIEEELQILEKMDLDMGNKFGFKTLNKKGGGDNISIGL